MDLVDIVRKMSCVICGKETDQLVELESVNARFTVFMCKECMDKIQAKQRR